MKYNGYKVAQWFVNTGRYMIMLGLFLFFIRFVEMLLLFS